MKLRYNNVANNLEEFRHVSVPMTCSRGNSSITVPTVAITGEKLKAFSSKLVFDKQNSSNPGQFTHYCACSCSLSASFFCCSFSTRDFMSSKRDVHLAMRVGISCVMSVPQPPQTNRSGMSLASSPTYLTILKPAYR